MTFFCANLCTDNMLLNPILGKDVLNLFDQHDCVGRNALLAPRET